MRITEGVHRVGNGMVNAYLVEEAGEVTVIDAGMPGLYRAFLAELATMGRTIEEVRAIVLTHGHSDHVGMAERIRRERGTPPWVHEADAALARGEVPNPSKGTGPYRIRPVLRFLLYALRQGGLRPPKIAEVSTYGEAATLDVPGSPRVILVPGHTPGSAALHMPRRDTLFVGDAFGTLAVTTGRTGPQLSPFQADRAAALASLDRLAGIDAAFALPGHGEPWTGGLPEAIRQIKARAAARS
jgi:glyoxylase-like metal-dependent hydrolase (beta-lactamase superfamily II)